MRFTCFIITAFLTLFVGNVLAIGNAMDGNRSSAQGGLVLSGDCDITVRRFDQVLPKADATSPLARLDQLGRLSESFGEDPSGCIRDRLIGEITKEKRRLIVLSVDRKAVPAHGIYMCPKLEDRLKCVGYSADDSLHLAELEALPITVSKHSNVVIKVYPGFHPEKTEIYVLIPSPDNKGLLNIRRLKEGAIRLPIERGEQTLIAIVHEKKNKITKYAWLLQMKSKGEP